MDWLLTIIDVGLALGFTLIVLSRKKRVPSVTLAWIFSFFFLPYVGFVLFSLLGYRNLRLRKRKRPKALRQARNEAPGEVPRLDDPELARLARLAEQLTGFSPVAADDVAIYEGVGESHEAMVEAIRSARSSVHLEFYIFQPDETGIQVRDALIETARAGIECRVLLDSIGSLLLHRAFLAPLRKSGAQVHFFGHGGITRPWGIQLRNHRKILIIDGCVAFTGSQNIGNEYNRGRAGAQSWRDTQVRLKGSAVAQLQKIFAEDWQFSSGEDLHSTRYFPECRGGNVTVQSLPTGPDEKPDALEMVIIQLIHQAKTRVTIVTPYFIPSVPLILALESASRRGVRVDIIVPKRSDSWIVDRASRSWFSDLVGNGIHIYEYGKRFVHSKVITVDGRVSLVGSANMDERSFKLNFECGLLVYDSQLTARLMGSFDEIRPKSRPVLFIRYRRESFLKRVTDGLFRILSPLL